MSQVLKDRIVDLEEALKIAKLQIEYLHDKFQPTGSGNAVLNHINIILNEKKKVENDLYWEEKLEHLDIDERY
jgi:hypothetical protein